ncbi:beta-lactamase/transpeptidase-like protein [Cadophora sp. DSE1049]|nr:beta-lactamase/transpeptidase-like protein [Cadophora sp. DSE1049]
MAKVQEHLAALQTTIELILKVSGSAGAPVGVIHNGQSHDSHYGFMDHGLTRKPDADNLYNIGSLSKTMMALTFADLVEKKVVSWNDTIHSIIPEFDNKDKSLTENCSILDLLSMRSGLPTPNILWYQGNSSPLVSKSSLISMVNGMTSSFPLRTDWRYSNWGYAIAGEIVKRKTGIDYPEQMSKSLFQPLGMTRITLAPEWREDANAAQGFSGLPDASLIPIRSQECDSSTLIEAAGGVCSSTKELLLYYGGLVAAMKQEIDGAPASSPVFKGLKTLYQGHITVGQKIETTTQYALGWVKGMLPGRVGVLSPNAGLLKEAFVLGKDTKPQVFFTHTGSLAGFMTTAILLPEKQSAIVVLVNSKASCDSSDFIASAILDKLIGGTGNHDFVELARSAMEKASQRYAEQSAVLESARVPGTSPKPLQEYEGRYYWSSRSYFVDIFVKDETLTVRFVDRSDQEYTMKHYHYDTFTWLMTDEEKGKRGRYIQATGAYIFIFETDEIERITGFKWAELGGGPGYFKKE